MANTLQTAMDLARLPMNDADPIDANRRYPDATLLKHANHGILTCYRARPDFWIGDYDNVPNGSMAATTPLTIPDEYVQVLADYITARCETTDDEFISSGRVEFFIKLFGGGANG